jgi:hypothetical protein
MPLHSLFGLAIGSRQSFVLPEMLIPRGNDEGFDVPIRILRVTEDAPLSGAVAAANPSILANRLEKIRCLVRSNFIFDGDQDWPKISIYWGVPFSIAGSRQWFQEVRSTVASGSRKNNARAVIVNVPAPAYSSAVPTPNR